MKYFSQVSIAALLLTFFASSPALATHPPGEPDKELSSEPEVTEAKRITPQQKLAVLQLTNIFENGAAPSQYDYIQDIRDGAGVTTGVVGFNTNAGDLLEVVTRYVSAKKLKLPAGTSIELEAYIPCLQTIKGTSTYSCLYPQILKTNPTQLNDSDWQDNHMDEMEFGEAWANAAKEKEMQKVQDSFVEEQLFKPADKWASRLGLHSALARAIIYDTVVQMPQLIEMEQHTRKEFAATHAGKNKPDPTIQQDEIDWLMIYNDFRRVVLCRTPVGCSTTDRVDSIDQLLKTQKNLDLKLPVTFTYDGNPFQIVGTPSGT